jgi:hypothetical protein
MIAKVFSEGKRVQSPPTPLPCLAVTSPLIGKKKAFMQFHQLIFACRTAEVNILLKEINYLVRLSKGAKECKVFTQ